MSLKKYLEDNEIDSIKEAQKLMEAEYTAVQTYCEICGYSITVEDFETIKSRGLEESFTDWKQTYVRDLWEDFGEVPMNPETEELEIQWKHFLPGTHREEIWHWFEEQFNISVAEDLMGQYKQAENDRPEVSMYRVHDFQEKNQNRSIGLEE